MAKPFQFTFQNQLLKASAEVFFDSGIMKYRIAFQSQLIVIREVSSSIGSATGIDYEQEVQPDEPALPSEFVQELGLGLEDVDFFPGSFWVSYREQDVEYGGQFVKNGNNYKMLFAVMPGKESVACPFMLTKVVKGDKATWQHDPIFPQPTWFDKMALAIESYENVKD